MTARTRQSLIRDLVQNYKSVQVSELSEMCEVTEETIRKDLNKLEAEGVLTRIHGGAIANENNEIHQGYGNTESTVTGRIFAQRREIAAESKKRIATLATGFVENDTTLFLDSSTTVCALMSAFPTTTDLTIVSNSAYFLQAGFAQNLRLISTGGEFQPKYMSLQGAAAIESVKKYNVDTTFFSCKALDMIRGAQDSHDDEAEIKKLMLERCNKAILLADHTKFDQQAFVEIADFDQFDVLITDQEPSDAWKEFLESHNVELVF